MEENKDGEEVEVKVLPLDEAFLKTVNQISSEKNAEIQKYIKEHFYLPLFFEEELERNIEDIKNYSIYFEQGPLSKDQLLFQTKKVANRIKGAGYKTKINLESKKPGLEGLEKVSTEGLVARLDVKKGWFYKFFNE